MVSKLDNPSSPDGHFSKTRFLKLNLYLMLQNSSNPAQNGGVCSVGIRESKTRAILQGSQDHKKTRFLKICFKFCPKPICAFLASCIVLFQLICIQKPSILIQNYNFVKKSSFLVPALFSSLNRNQTGYLVGSL